MGRSSSSSSSSSHGSQSSRGKTWNKQTSWNKYKVNKQTRAQSNAAEAAVRNFGKFSSPYQKQLNNTINAINNSKFNYDVNKDAIYNQYKERYTAMGNAAMQEAQADATALTGGFANSYAESAGQNAFNSYIQQLQNVVPQLYSQARTNYDTDLANLYNKANLYSGLNQQAYQQWSDSLNQAISNRDYYYNKDWNAYQASAKTITKEKGGTSSKGKQSSRSSGHSSSKSSKK